MSIASVRIGGRDVGAVLHEEGLTTFQYDPEWIATGLDLSPIMMPLSKSVHSFPQPFGGLPGLLADSLPDRFGNALIDAWLARTGRSAENFNQVDRLCYVGTRGMGALEFFPSRGPRGTKRHNIEIAQMVDLASSVLRKREGFETSMEKDQAVKDLLSIGTSAGGARAKAVIAWNEKTGKVRSGQVEAGPGFEYWLIKFDGVADTREGNLTDPRGYGLIEYAYSLMAAAAGVTMNPCRIMEEGGRSHFMTRRFDRDESGKIHMQTLSALAHLDFGIPHHSYEQALQVGRRLALPAEDLEQQFKRMVFNVVARNQDDHVKNIAFLMDGHGQWRLSPAYDVAYAYNPSGQWTSTHQMSINGQRDNFTLADLKACAATTSLRRNLARDTLREVTEAVSAWPEFAAEAGVPEPAAKEIGRHHRLVLPTA
ncbi:MAG: type II toxin-antitoxin system HipA family toxin [Solirubrobacterales bacterium]